MANIEQNSENLIVKNLVIFPGVVAKFSNSTINVQENLVILGELSLVSSNVKSKNIFNGYTGSLKQLQSMIGFTDDQVIELIKRLNSK